MAETAQSWGACVHLNARQGQSLRRALSKQQDQSAAFSAVRVPKHKVVGKLLEEKVMKRCPERVIRSAAGLTTKRLRPLEWDAGNLTSGTLYDRHKTDGSVW